MEDRECNSCVDIDLVKGSLNCGIESTKTATTTISQAYRVSLVNEVYNVRSFPNFIPMQIDSKSVAPRLINEGLIQSGDSYKFFRKFVSNIVLDRIVSSTSEYATMKLAEMNSKEPHSNLRRWKSVRRGDVLFFIASNIYNRERLKLVISEITSLEIMQHYRYIML